MLSRAGELKSVFLLQFMGTGAHGVAGELAVERATEAR